MNRYRAYYIPKGSRLRAGLIGVLADDEEAAHERIREELSKPGRHGYLRQWQDSGEIVECLDEEPEASR